MNHPTVKIQMFGSFMLKYGDCTVTEEDSRSRKIWLLLAFLIYCRNRSILPSELTDLLWDDGDEKVNPQGALKTTLYRLRSLLSPLKEAVGCDLVINQNGTYAWNPDLLIDFDVEQFDRLYKEGRKSERAEDTLDFYRQAIELYTGDFLPKLSMESWVVPIAAYFHNQYITIVKETLSLLETSRQHAEAVALCHTALRVEPYNEDLYRHLMKNLITTGQRKSAAAAYQDLSKLLMNNFGIIPPEDITVLYREAIRTDNGYVMPEEVLRDQLRETNPSAGAMFCEYDAFKLLYQALARSISRSGDVYHIALLSVKGFRGKALSKRSLNLAMKNLQIQILGNMRRGDIATRCSASQFIIMLPKANYEGSCIVCARILRAFYRQHPHSPVDISYSVQPMEPTI